MWDGIDGTISRSNRQTDFGVIWDYLSAYRLDRTVLFRWPENPPVSDFFFIKKRKKVVFIKKNTLSLFLPYARVVVLVFLEKNKMSSPVVYYDQTTKTTPTLPSQWPERGTFLTCGGGGDSETIELYERASAAVPDDARTTREFNNLGVSVFAF